MPQLPDAIGEGFEGKQVNIQPHEIVVCRVRLRSRN
jgi:hypothetical protein